jgi:hypothetical protein
MLEQTWAKRALPLFLTATVITGALILAFS